MNWSEEEEDNRLLSEATDAIERQLTHQEQLGDPEEGDDRLLSEAVDAIERQLAHQEQLGGSLSASEPGRF